MQASEAVEKERNMDRIHAFPATTRVSGLLLPSFPHIRNILDRSQMSEVQRLLGRLQKRNKLRTALYR